MTEQPWDRLISEIVRQHASQIGEHCDTVQIFVTRQSPGSETTESYQFGTGNIFARESQAREWVIRQDEYVREEARISQRKDLE